MDSLNYKDLSTAEKILLVEEIWDSISEDKIALTKQQKEVLDDRLECYNKSEAQLTWDAIKTNVKTKNNK